MSAQTLQKKVAIVTGGGGGLGSAMTLALAEAGARVAAVDVSQEAANATAERARQNVGDDCVLPLAFDIRQSRNCIDIVERTVGKFGGVHVLVNNAGIGMASVRRTYMAEPVKFWEVSDEQWQAVMDTNAKAAFLMTKAALPHFLEQKWGRVVNVTTSLDTMMRPNYSPYGPSKAALESASAIWAEDLKGTGVNVNVLVPGGPANTGFIPDVGGYDRSHLVQPTVMVTPVVWLASEASDNVTGRRFIGTAWNPELQLDQAAELAGAPCAWPDAGTKAVWPGSKRD